MHGFVCPWWLAYTFDHRGRRLFQKPEEILAPYVRPGMTVMDVGCGLGFFTIGMAGLVGDSGAVLAVDVQQKMLDILMKRAARAGVAHRVRTYRCEPDALGVHGPVDFAAAFYMVHETHDKPRFLEQIRACLKPGAGFFLAEPKGHVSGKSFLRTVQAAEWVGFRLLDRPHVPLSHAAYLVKPET
jgi:ubiquinone/menaquinone biosynthesis C-methylase UbiE